MLSVLIAITSRPRSGTSIDLLAERFAEHRKWMNPDAAEITVPAAPAEA